MTGNAHAVRWGRHFWTHVGAPDIVVNVTDFSRALVGGGAQPTPKFGHPIKLSVLHQAMGVRFGPAGFKSTMNKMSYKNL